MIELYTKDGVKKELLEVNDIIKKSYGVTANVQAGVAYKIGSLASLGAKVSNMITPLMIGHITSLPSSRSIHLTLLNEYNMEVYVVSNVSQKIGFTIEWLEKA